MSSLWIIVKRARRTRPTENCKWYCPTGLQILTAGTGWRAGGAVRQADQPVPAQSPKHPTSLPVALRATRCTFGAALPVLDCGATQGICPPLSPPNSKLPPIFAHSCLHSATSGMFLLACASRSLDCMCRRCTPQVHHARTLLEHQASELRNGRKLPV